MARTLFFTSDLALSAAEKKQGIAAFAGNHALCKITEDLIFTDPYRIAEQNRWTAPYLDGLAAELRDDMELHVAVSRLKLKFMASPEALLHGDLHTGSIMVTESETRVIDPGIRLLRPDGFRRRRRARQPADGLFRLRRPRARAGRAAANSRAGCWRRSSRSGTSSRENSSISGGRTPRGDAYPVSLFAGEKGAARLELERQAYMQRLFTDTVGFAAAKDHPPHLRPRPQHRLRADRGSRGSAPSAKPAPCGSRGE